MIRSRDSAWWRARKEILEHALYDQLEISSGRLLKTDLYDEAAGPHHHAAGVPVTMSFLGVDRDFDTVKAARRRLKSEGRNGLVIVADVRRLPLKAGVVELIFSPSSLDHFEGQGEIRRSIAELERVTGPGGHLFLTLDNPFNLEVWLRAHLPERLVRWLRADRFPLGRIPRPARVARWLQEVGLQTFGHQFLLHAPRYPLIRLVQFFERRGWSASARAVARLVVLAEMGRHLPTAGLTGHYVAWLAQKPEQELLN